MSSLRIALTKGRLEKQTVELFEKMGLDCDELKNKGRRLILSSQSRMRISRLFWQRRQMLLHMLSTACATSA